MPRPLLSHRSEQQRRTVRSCGKRCGVVGEHWLLSTRCCRSHQRRATSSPPHSEGELTTAIAHHITPHIHTFTSYIHTLTYSHTHTFTKSHAHLLTHTFTCTRYNKARLERLRRAREEKDFEKIFKPSFWSYSKSMLKQPITVLEGEKGDDLEETTLKLFYTIQQHAGECVCGGGGDCRRPSCM